MISPFRLIIGSLVVLAHAEHSPAPVLSQTSSSEITSPAQCQRDNYHLLCCSSTRPPVDSDFANIPHIDLPKNHTMKCIGVDCLPWNFMENSAVGTTCVSGSKLVCCEKYGMGMAGLGCALIDPISQYFEWKKKVKVLQAVDTDTDNSDEEISEFVNLWKL